MSRSFIRLSSGAAILAASLLAPLTVGAQEGPVRVEVRGIDGELRANVLAVLSLARSAEGGPLAETRVRRLHDRATREIELALQPFGRYQPRVESTLEFTGGRWLGIYAIDPGPAVRLHRADIGILGPGEADPFFQQALQRLPLVPGEPLSHARYEALKLSLGGVAAERGYLDAVFDTAVIRVDRENLQADIVLHLNTGPRFQFGTVTFLQDVLDPGLLQRMVPFRAGSPWDGAQLLALQNALTEGPYFTSVEIVPRRELAEDLRVPLDVQMIPDRPQRYLLGAGYGTDTGPRATLESEFRRLNRSGHRAEGQARASLVERRISGRYSLPLRARGSLLSFSAGFVDSNPSTSDTETFLIGASFSHLLWGWKQDLSLTYQRASYEVGVDSGLSNLFILGTALSRIRADDRIYPSWGRSILFRIQGGHEGLLSDTRFLQVGAEGKIVKSLSPRVRILARGEIGALLSESFGALPATFRYFAGGDRSVRGHQYQSLGPLDPEGDVAGGARLLVSSLEVDFRVLDQWGFAAFFDVGNALDSFSDSLEQGAGLGIRWRSPVGPIRLDGAFALSRAGSPFRIHLNIGPEL